MNAPTTPALESAFMPPEDGTGIKISEVALTPEDCERIITTLGFERQRDTDYTHARMLADMMANNEFAGGSQLTFAFDANGNPRLVDGQHRLRAAVIAGWSGKWSVRTVHDGDVQDAAGLYVLLDGHQKKRPPAVMGRALGIEELHVRTQSVAVATAKYMNLWRTDYILPTNCAYPPIRDNVALVRARLEAFLEMDRILNLTSTSSQARRKMTTAQVLAVTVETLACSEGPEAREFWTQVASNGDGVAGALRDQLIAGKPPRAGALYVPRLVAHAWNRRGQEALRSPNKRRAIPVQGTTLEIPA